MLESEAYKTYHAYATSEKIPKHKYGKNKVDPESSPKKKTAPVSKGSRVKSSTKMAKFDKKKQPATKPKSKTLTVLSDVALSEHEQMKIVTKRNKTQYYSSHTSGSGEDEGIVNMSEDDDQNDDNVDDQDDDDQDDDNDDESNNDQDEDNEQTESDNDADDFIHPKLSTFDENERQDKEDKEEEWSDDEAYDEETQGGNVEGEELDEEETNEEEEANELYRDVNINLERRDTKMAGANVQATQVIEDTHVIITAATPEVQQQSSSVSSGFISSMLNPNPDTGIDSILNLNTESIPLVDVYITTNVEMPPSSVTTLPPPPIPLIQPLQQTPVPTPTIFLSTSLQNLPTFGSLFKFEDRVKALEDNFSEFKQTNPFA
ncbi:hypothetical protein Tco_0891914 [Tanacetum coccineum]|uniref:Uncharacterized protein n=1 Tax=Tanacetum coccineum TaxID=301880 RepID=A0ABQ5C779_9ASTR